MRFFETFTYTVGIIVVAIIVSSIYFVGNGINETDTIVRKGFYKCAKIISKRNSFREASIKVSYYFKGRAYEQVFIISKSAYEAVDLNKKIKFLMYHQYPGHPLLYRGEIEYCEDLISKNPLDDFWENDNKKKIFSIDSNFIIPFLKPIK